MKSTNTDGGQYRSARSPLIQGTVTPATSSKHASGGGALLSSSVFDEVPIKLPEGFDAISSKQRVVDALFRPTHVDWNPFLCDLDLPRSQTAEIFEEVELKTKYLDKQSQALVMLRGEAGIGKSTCLKRLAVLAAKAGMNSWWARRAPPGLLRQMYIDFAKALAERKTKDGLRSVPTVVFCDDPYALRIDIRDILKAFDTASVPIVLVVAVRNSDALVNDASSVDAVATPDTVIELSHSLDDAEIGALPQFLVNLGITTSLERAHAEVANIPNRDSRDILCSLWYLLPETKAQLSASIQDEYFRLGGITGALSAFATRASEMSDTARRAYECVAVTSNLQISIPLEVLVSALQISYEEWMQMCVHQRPVWGLLYDDVDPENDNIVFHTRNHVVTQVLLELVNGGVGHAGEFRVLKALVSACNKATVAYRQFLVDIFVTKRQELSKILSYEWGVELFELALAVFPTSDRTIEHHFGWWHRWVGRRPQLAYAQYEKALGAAEYQYATKREMKEHIHTSMAATVVELVRQGGTERSNALEMIKMHLQEANTGAFVDPHSDHVFANSLFQLARTERGTPVDAVSLESIAEALRTIERSLQTIGSAGRRRKDFFESIRALQELQTNIVSSIPDIEDAKQYAEEMFQSTKSQVGYEVIGRKLLHDAGVSARGAAYKAANDYVAMVIDTVARSSEPISIDLRAVRIDILVRWRLQQVRGPVDWDALRRELEILTTDRRYQNDLVKHYYLAVTLFHLGEVTQAQAIFRTLQRKNPSPRVRFGRRNVFVGNEGLPRREQGELRIVHERIYVFFPALSIELEASGMISDRRHGATVHCYIAFTLSGAYAIFEQPGKDEFVLA